MDVLAKSKLRREEASSILKDLNLEANWSRFGRPVVVGAFACDLMMAPDIDMEVYCPLLRIEDGFQVLSECSLNSRVKGVRMVNELSGPDKALYWQISYRSVKDELWKIDIWSAPDDYALPRGENFVKPMREALSMETRRAILELKEARTAGLLPEFLSIDLYRAVLDGGVRTVDDFKSWVGSNKTGVLTDWRPGACARG